jgi:flagellar basal-body rod modification protein FlgD
MNVNGVTPNAASGGTQAPTSNPAKDTESVFLNLLVTELKSQDPTSPMDPIQMVGQMLSMNQLDQLIQINQTIQGALSPTTGAN